MMLSTRRVVLASSWPLHAGRRQALFLLSSFAIACAARLPSSAASVSAERFRQEPPPAAAAAAFVPPVPHRSALANGLQVWVLPKRSLPVVHAAIVVRSGAADDPKTAPGLTTLLGKTLELGTRSKDAQALAEAIETLGASLDVSVGLESTTLRTSALTNNAAQALAILAEVARDPRLAAADIERSRQVQLAELSGRASNPAAVGQLVLRQVLFAQHPYGQDLLGSAAAVRGLKVQAVRRRHAEMFRPDKAALILVGDIDETAAMALANDVLGDWRIPAERGVNNFAPQPPSARPAEVALVERAKAPQAQVLVGGLGAPRRSPDYPAMLVANAVAGGLFNSRINMNLREDKGWTYGARSGFSFLRGGGLFAAASSIRSDVAAPGAQEIFRELERLRTERISADELAAAKNSLVLGLAGGMQSAEGIAGKVAELFVHELPTDDWQQYASRVAAVTSDEVLTVSQRYFAADQLSLVVVGDADETLAHVVTPPGHLVQHRSVEGRVLPSATKASSVPPAATR